MRALILGLVLMLGAGGALADKFVLCEDSVGSGLDCYAGATERAYEYCRKVQSIVIIEYGLQESMEGTNGAKLAACTDKYQRDLKASYVASLKEMARHRGLTEKVKEAHAFWAESVASLAPRQGESEVDYHARVSERLQHLKERMAALKQEVAERVSALAHKASGKPKTKS